MGQYPKGSEWRKWDLHVHSPFSILNNQYLKLPDGTPNWEPFISKLESLDIAVVGITDYFTIEVTCPPKTEQFPSRIFC